MNACCWSLLTMPSLFVTIFLILVLVMINTITLVHTAVVVPDPFSPVSLPGMKAKAGEAGLNSETELPPTGESGEDGQYYDDDPSVTFVTDEDIYEDFGGGLPPSGMSRLQHGHYQPSAGSFASKKHEDERCPPPQHPPALSDTRLCRRRKCIKDSDCSSDESIVCCYNGCIHSCQRKVDPPLAFDWLEETELKGLRNSTETTTATSLGPKSLMNAQVTPETIALPGGCFLNAQQYEHLRLFRKYQHVHSCTCTHGDVVCHVNIDKDRIETTGAGIDLQLPVPASASASSR